MQKSNTTTAEFLRELLKGCIGGVMIEPEQWNFPEEAFDRGYLNERLKRIDPLNATARKRILFVFSHLFTPEKRNNSKYGEYEAVEGSNQLISLFKEYFDVDMQVWMNSHEGENSAKRSHLMACLEIVLSILENTTVLPITECHLKLTEYIKKASQFALNRAQEYPCFYKKYPNKMTDHFIGRDTIITSVIDTIIIGRPVLLHGIGGIGKTEIAKVILNRIMSIPISEHGIQYVLWVHYSENNFVRSLIEAMDFDSSAHNMDRKFQEAIEVINQYKEKMLMVIDNVETDKDPILLQVTQYLKCRILVTSRENSFSDFTSVSIPAMGTEDCIRLFYSYYNNLHDDVTLRKIIALADNHTVTVELLAKVADTEEVFLHEFYNDLIRCGFHISDEEAKAAHEKMQTDGRIIEQLQKLFSIYGFSQSEDHLLTQVSTIPSVSFRFEQAKRWFSLRNRTDLNNLARRGWIKKESIHNSGRSYYQYVMHSVIASAIREQRKNILYNSCETFIREITRDMQQITEKNDYEKKKLIQFSWSINDVFKNDFHSENDADFLWALSEIYRDIGYYEQALSIIKLVKSIYINLYGEDCIQLASAWNSYGLIHYELSHYEEALKGYNKSYEIITNYVDIDNLTTLEKSELGKLNLNMGNAYRKTDLSKAGPHLETAYNIFLDLYGADNYLTMLALGYKAFYLEEAGCLSDAEKTYLEIYARSDDPDQKREMLLLHGEVAHHLGAFYCDHAPDKAMSYLLDAKDVFWNQLSPTHPDTLDVLNTICTLRLQINDNYESVLEELEYLLGLYIDVYGEKAPNVGTIYNNIGLCHYYLNHPDEAVENYRIALSISDVVNGSGSVDSAYIYNNIGAVYSESGNPTKAIKEHMKALQIYESAFPERMNLDLAQTYNDLADASLRLGDLDRCMDYLNNAFPIYEGMLPENSFHLLSPYSTLANLLVESNDFIQAEIVYGHIIWLMLENGYEETSTSVQEFTVRLEEIKLLAEKQRKMEGEQ